LSSPKLEAIEKFMNHQSFNAMIDLGHECNIGLLSNNQDRLSGAEMVIAGDVCYRQVTPLA